MISIKKHLDSLEGAKAILEAYQDLIDGVLTLTRERMPSRDAADRRSFTKELNDWLQNVRSLYEREAVDASSSELVALLAHRWDRVATYLGERERDLTSIISLLAETAGRLDRSNKDFYKNLHRSIETLEAIGKYDDISTVRRALSEHVSRLEEAVSQQETRVRDMMADFETNLKTAQSQVEVMGRLVTADPLQSLPSRRHAEEYLKTLIDQQQAVSIGILVALRVDSIERRYGDDCADEVLLRFSSALRERLPAKAHLYRWERASFVVFADQMPVAELKDLLGTFLEQVGSKPFEIDEKSRRSVSLDPQYVVHGVEQVRDAPSITRLIDQFCQTSSKSPARA